MTALSTADVVRRTGLGYRQLNYWDLQKAIVPDTPARGSGSRIRWSSADVERLQVIYPVTTLFAMGGKGVGIPVALVNALWQALDGEPDNWPPTLHCWKVDDVWRVHHVGPPCGAAIRVIVHSVIRRQEAS